MTVARPPFVPSLDQPYPGAPFGVAYARFWKKGFTFTGRASRSEYWKVWLVNVGITALIYFVALVPLASASMQWLMWVLLLGALLYALAALIPAIAIVVRRLHDANYSGGMYFVSLIPFLGGIILLILLAQDSNRNGSRFDVPDAGHYDHVAGMSSAGRIPPPPPRPVTAPVVPLPPAPQPSVPLSPPLPPMPMPGLAAPPAPPTYAAPPSAAPSFAPLPIPPQPIAPWPISVAPIDAVPLVAPVDDVGETRLSPAVASAQWVVDLPDGRRIPATVDGLHFGRSPVAGDEHRDAVLVPVDDPAKSMSKTHGRIAVVGDRIEVTDLFSTNGITVKVDGHPSASLAPGRPETFDDDATVRFGDYAVSVRRNGGSR